MTNNDRSNFEMILDRHCAVFHKMYSMPIECIWKKEECIVEVRFCERMNNAILVYPHAECARSSTHFAKDVFLRAIVEKSGAIVCTPLQKQKRGLKVKRNKFGLLTLSDGFKTTRFYCVYDLASFLFESSDNNDIGSEMSAWAHEVFDFSLQEITPRGAEYTLYEALISWTNSFSFMESEGFKSFVEWVFEPVN